MNWRWYITGLIVALAFIGISLDQSNSDANQEILVQFNTDSISVDQAQRAVADIENQLKSIGVEDVQVSETSDGRLKVTYYSTVDVAVIKRLFSKHNKLHVHQLHVDGEEDSSKTPFTSDSNTYIVDVFQIQNDFNTYINLQGMLVELKSANNHYVKPHMWPVTSELDLDLICNSESGLAIDVSTISLFVNDCSHIIPEVRAGPFS